ncbi:MAG: efflux RND transporter periplasmic adaptor subunit [Clostridia bacterium]|nr:efflux RND transporter periplasmic adaptor subunit [Clostridia bacterium]
MKRKVRIVLLTTSAVLLVMLLWIANREQDAPVATVRGTHAIGQDIYNSVYVPGEVEAQDSYDYATTTGATVEEVYVKAGQTVKTGQPLVRLREDAVALNAESAQAFAEEILDGEQSVDGRAVASALRGSATPKERVHTVTAERDGTVLRAPESAGESVLPRLTYLRTADISRLLVRADIPELYVRQVAEGQRANVTTDASPDDILAAKVVSIAPYARRAVSLNGQQQSATVTARLSLVGKQPDLRPGYSVNVKIFTDAIQDAVLVPYEAIGQENGQEFVFVVRQGIAHKLYVETGYELDGYIQIKTGISVGDIVLVSPPAALKDGDRVEVADA